MHPTAKPRTKSEIQALLVRAGITPTAQRLEIAWVILDRPQHLSAEQILNLVNRAGSTVSKATVYNTLGLFARKGIIREVLVDPNRVFFDSNTDEHYHLYNEDTGILTDLYANCLQPDALPTLPENSTLVGIDVIIRVRNK
jgi:Fur family iron response transcriptional regulator